MAQHMQATGHNKDEILGRMLIKTAEVLDGCYLPSGRHQSGVQRVLPGGATPSGSEGQQSVLGHAALNL